MHAGGSSAGGTTTHASTNLGVRPPRVVHRRPLPSNRVAVSVAVSAASHWWISSAALSLLPAPNSVGYPRATAPRVKLTSDTDSTDGLWRAPVSGERGLPSGCKPWPVNGPNGQDIDIGYGSWEQATLLGLETPPVALQLAHYLKSGGRSRADALDIQGKVRGSATLPRQGDVEATCIIVQSADTDDPEIGEIQPGEWSGVRWTGWGCILDHDVSGALALNLQLKGADVLDAPRPDSKGERIEDVEVARKEHKGRFDSDEQFWAVSDSASDDIGDRTASHYPHYGPYDSLHNQQHMIWMGTKDSMGTKDRPRRLLNNPFRGARPGVAAVADFGHARTKRSQP